MRLGETADHSIMIVDSEELDNFTKILDNFEKFKNALHTIEDTENPIQKNEEKLVDEMSTEEPIKIIEMIDFSPARAESEDSSSRNSKRFTTDTEYADETLEFLKIQMKQKNLNPLPYIPYPQIKSELAEMMRKIQEGEEIDEGRFELLSECLNLSPEHRAELAEQERKWMADNRERIEQSLETMRAFISAGIFNVSQQAFMDQTGYSKNLVKRLYFKKCLWLVRMQPSDIARLHHSDLTTKYNPEGQGLDLTETLAILGQILKVNFQNDPGKKKEEWKKKLIEASRKMTDQFERGALSKNMIRNPCYVQESGNFATRESHYTLPSPEVMKELSLSDISSIRRNDSVDKPFVPPLFPPPVSSLPSTKPIPRITPVKRSNNIDGASSSSPSPLESRSPLSPSLMNPMAAALNAALAKRRSQNN